MSNDTTNQLETYYEQKNATYSVQLTGWDIMRVRVAVSKAEKVARNAGDEWYADVLLRLWDTLLTQEIAQLVWTEDKA